MLESQLSWIVIIIISQGNIYFTYLSHYIFLFYKRVVYSTKRIVMAVIVWQIKCRLFFENFESTAAIAVAVIRVVFEAQTVCSLMRNS